MDPENVTPTEVTPEETVEVQTKTVVADTEPEVETPAAKTETTPEPKAPEEDKKHADSSLEQEPFNKKLKFKERLEEIENKYKGKADNWDAFIQGTETDLDTRLKAIKILESQGKVPQGTHAMAVEAMAPKKKEEKKPVPNEEVILEQLQKLPAVQYANKLYEDAQKQEEIKRAETEAILTKFEEEHADIATQPVEVKGTIATVAAFLRTKSPELSLADSLNQAYDTLFNREGLIQTAREDGEIEAKIKATQKEVISTPSSTTTTTHEGLRKLTAEEERARQSLGGDSAGWSRESYIKFKDGDGQVE